MNFTMPWSIARRLMAYTLHGALYLVGWHNTLSTTALPYRSTAANKYTQAELQLMKTQDINYVTLKAQVDAKVRKHLVCAVYVVTSATFPTTENRAVEAVAAQYWGVCTSATRRVCRPASSAAVV